jgi:hypothetical protein
MKWSWHTSCASLWLPVYGWFAWPISIFHGQNDRTADRHGTGRHEPVRETDGTTRRTNESVNVHRWIVCLPDRSDRPASGRAEYMAIDLVAWKQPRAYVRSSRWVGHPNTTAFQFVGKAGHGREREDEGRKRAGRCWLLTKTPQPDLDGI